MIDGKYITECCQTANADCFENSTLIIAEEATSHFEEYKFNELDKSGFGGIIIGNYTDTSGIRKIIACNPSHAMIIGGTGSGKTEGYYLPTIEAYAKSDAGVSMLITDTKGTIYEKTNKFLSDNGYNIYVLNFKEPFSSMRYNPLSYIFDTYKCATNYRDLSENANGITYFDGKTYDTPAACAAAIGRKAATLFGLCQTHIDFIATLLCPIESERELCWDYGSRDIVFSTLCGMLEDSDYPQCGMTKEKFTLANLINVTACTKSEYAPILKWIKAHPLHSKVQRLLQYYDIAARQTRDSYTNNTANKLNRYANLPIETITAATDIDLPKIVSSLDTKKVAIYCIADENTSICHTICSMFIYQLVELLQRHRDKQPFGTSKPFMFLMDEFANMPILSEMDKWLSTARSRNVWFHLGLQSLSQLRNLYGVERAHVISDNCETQLFLGSNDYTTIQEFCSSLGSTCKTVTNYSMDSSGRLIASFSPQSVPLVRESDLALLQPEHGYVRRFRKPILYTTLEYYYKYHNESSRQPYKCEGFHSFDAKSNFYDITSIPESAYRRRYQVPKPSVDPRLSISEIKQAIVKEQPHTNNSRTTERPKNSIEKHMLYDFLKQIFPKGNPDNNKELLEILTDYSKMYDKSQFTLIYSPPLKSSDLSVLGILYREKPMHMLYPFDDNTLAEKSMFLEVLTLSDDRIAFNRLLCKLDIIATREKPDNLYISLPVNSTEQIQNTLRRHGFKDLPLPTPESKRIAYKL